MRKLKSLMLVIMCFIILAFCTPPAFAFSIADIPNNTLKLGDDFFDLSSDPMNDPDAVVAINSLLKDGPNKNVAYFKFGDKWYDPFSLTEAQFLDPAYALTDDQVNAISGFNKWYKAGSEVVNIPRTLTNCTVGGTEPDITGTAAAPVLTFAVDPDYSYTTGTATLSAAVNYRIQAGGGIDFQGTASPSDPVPLMQQALDLLAAAGGTPGDGVQGQTLLDRTPVTITLTSADVQTVYTINFVAEPTLSSCTVGGIAPSITGTPEAPVLTFAVDPAAEYSTGTATLSEDVSYIIHNDTYDINGEASPSDPVPLMQQALNLIAAYGGADGVYGSTLIANSPLTITIIGANATTVYTVNFEQQ